MREKCCNRQCPYTDCHHIDMYGSGRIRLVTAAESIPETSLLHDVYATKLSDDADALSYCTEDVEEPWEPAN